MIEYTGVIRLLFLIGHLHFIGEDQKTSTMKTHVEKCLDYIFKV